MTTRRSSELWSGSRKVWRLWRATTTSRYLQSTVRSVEALLSFQNISHLNVGEQVVYVATYSYFILSLIGYQQLTSEPEILFPVFLVLKFVFFIGWLKV